MANRLDYRIILDSPTRFNGGGRHVIGRMASEGNAKVAARACAKLYPEACNVIVERGRGTGCVAIYKGQYGQG